MTEHEHTPPRPGESAAFHFETTWRVAADRQRVWEVLTDVSSWSEWWPGISGSRRDGDHARLVVRSPLGYRLDFTLDLVSSAPPERASFTVDGDLRGVGRFFGDPDGDGTRIGIVWCVVTRRRLIGALRPVAGWAHDAVMRAGQRGLRRVSHTL